MLLYRNLEIVVKGEDINFLLEYLHNYSYQWRLIGMSLAFQYYELENIRHNSPNLPTQVLLTELLFLWSQWPTTAHPHVPTMEKLCSALRSGLVGLGALANELHDLRTQLPSQRNLNPRYKTSHTFSSL